MNRPSIVHDWYLDLFLPIFFTALVIGLSAALVFFVRNGMTFMTILIAIGFIAMPLLADLVTPNNDVGSDGSPLDTVK